MPNSAEQTELVPTMVFIDYESLHISFNNVFKTKPDLKTLVEDFRKVGRLVSIKVFGDFTKPELSLERNRIRTITNFIIDCGSETTDIRKDFSDFIMLDHIYQDTISNDHIKQFIVVTGDGHFSSVATFLRMHMDKIVGVYSIRDSLARQLRECASWTRVIEVVDDEEEEYVRRLAYSLRRAEDEGKIATFMKTCEVVSNYHQLEFDTCRRVLQMMITKGLVSTELTTAYGNREMQRLLVNMTKVEAHLQTISDSPHHNSN